MPDKIDQLFDDLQSRGYAKDKTRKQFRDYMLAPGKQGYENRKAFFEDFKGNGETNLKNYEEFKGLLGLRAVKKGTPSVYQKARPADANPLERARQAQSAKPTPTQKPAQRQTTAPQAKPTPVPEGFGELDINKATQMGMDKVKPVVSDPMFEGVPDHEETVVEKTQRMLKGKAAPQETKQVQKRLQQRKDEMEYEKETGKQLRNEGMDFSFEAPTLARDENGEIIKGENGQPLIGRTTDNDIVDTHNQVAAEQEAYDLDKQIEEAQKELEQLDVEIDKGRFDQANRLLGGMLPGNQMKSDYNAQDMEQSNLLAAKRMLERRITALEAERDNPGFWAGTGDQLKDPTSWSFGLTDAEDALVMQNIKKKIDSANGGEPNLTRGEQIFVDNYMKNQEAQKYNERRKWSYGAGKGFGQTLSFMKDFAVSGGGFANVAKAGMKAGAKLGAKAATKTLGNYMTKNLGTKALGKAMEYIGKGAGLAAGAEAGGFLLNNTVQAASSAADIINKNTGNLTYDKDGKLAFKDGMGIGKAILKSQIERTGENGSELFGIGFDAVPNILGRVIQRTTAGKALKKLTDTKLWKKGEGALDYLGVQSVWGEGMEEEYNMARTELLNQITGGEFEDSGLFDLDKQLDTWKTVGLTSMLLRVPTMIASGTRTANYYANQYNLNTSDKNMRGTFDNQERYDTVKEMLDNADNKDIAGVLSNLMKNGQLSNDEKKAVMLYANDLIKVRGFNIGNVVAAANGYKDPPTVSNYKVDGLHVDAVDKDGNVIESYDYENPDELKAGLYGMQQKRADKRLQSDISIMKSRPDNQFFEFSLQFFEAHPEYAGIYDSFDDFAAVLEKPSMERTDEEQQMVATFSDMLHNAVYDNTMLHEEQSMEDGEALADSDSIDLEADSQQGVNVVNGLTQATENRNALFEKNEDLKQEVESMENQGLSHQEIISNLETFKPEEVQGMIEYYNAQAKYEGYMSRKEQKIDEEAANSRQRHTFKGTINGQADVQNVYTITDGTNEYYLVSGNISTDPATGEITGSASGLVIGMDLDGSFVQLSDTDGYSVMPSTQTLDQFEEAERLRLQEQVTSVIDPNGTLAPQEEEVAAEQQPTGQTEEQPVAEAGAEGTGANEATTALSKIPVNEDGQPVYTQAEPSDSYDALVEQVGEQGAGMLAKSELNDAKKRLEKMQKDLSEGKVKGNTMQEKIAEMQNMQKAIDEEKRNIAYWGNVMEVPKERQKVASEVQQTEPVQPVQPEVVENVAPETVEEAPEYRYDTPEAARKRGYKVVEGQRIDRQEEKPEPKGMEVEIQYSTKDKVKGHLTVSELGDVQGSHLTNGQRNEKHFIPEAQPKAEFGADRQTAAQVNAAPENFRPELMLTFNGTQSAYSGSTTQTNRRGEVIQGNGRRNLAEYIYALGNEASAKRYKEFLMAHAEELGTTAEEIANMEKPFAHIVLDVTDEEAIRLGQFTAQDLESGGKKIPEVSSTVVKLGDKFSSLANIVLKHDDPDASLAERIEANTEDAVKWLNRGGFINDTQAKTLLEDKSLARQFMKDLLTDTLFSGASPDLRTMFYELPKNIQSAIVSVVGREVTVENRNSILEDLRESIQAYHELMTSSPQFASASGRNYEDRKRASDAAVDDWLRQINMDGTKNTEKFSNFALELAKLYRSLKDQKTLSGRLREYYDLVSGASRQMDMFGETTTSGPISKEEAIKQIFGIDYGRQRTVPLAGDNQAGQGGEQGGTNRPQTGEREESEPESPDTGRGDTGNAEVESREDYLASHPLTEEQIMADAEATEDEKLNAVDFLNGEDDSAISRFYYDGIYNRAATQSQQTGQTEEEIKSTIDSMKSHAIVVPEVEITDENWKDNVETPIGNVKMGENQKEKLFVRGREQQYGMMLETLSNPDIVLEEKDKEQNMFHERPSSYLFVKTFVKPDGSKYIHFESVTVSQDGMEISISSHIIRENQLKGKLKSDRLLYKATALDEPAISSAEQPTNAGGSHSSESKDSEKEDNLQENQQENVVGEEKNNTSNPVEAIEQAAESFREQQKTQDQADIDSALKEFSDFLDNAKGNSLLGKFFRKGIEGNDKAQANLLDAFTLTNEAQRMFLKDLLRLASKVGYAYIKSGVHDVQAWSKQMTDTIGKKLKEVLGWDDAIIGEFVDEVWNQKYTVDGQRMRMSEHAERLKNNKGEDNTVNVNKEENNEPENDVNLQQEEESEAKPQNTEQLQGDSAEFAERRYKLEQLSKKIKAKLQGIVNWGDQPKPLSTYKQIAKELGIDNLSDTDLQELIEAEVVNIAREISNKENLSDEKKFEKIAKLYQSQPTLSARDNDRINKQQYSTPAPMAYLMGLFTSKGKKVESGLEPSAGNGMLTVNLPKEKMHVNDIDEMRLSNLQKQGFGQVTSQDGTLPFGDKKYDVIVTNPPFGSVTPKVYDGLYEISALEHQMAINALESMKDDGRAAIIIGGNTDYNTNGTIKGRDRTFLNYLYAHYNVVDVINMDGKSLYTKQGTGFPVRMILIDGRKELNPKNFAPVQSKARAEQVKTYDELYKRVNDDILRNEQHPGRGHSGTVVDTPNNNNGQASGQGDAASLSGHVNDANQEPVRLVRPGGGGRNDKLGDSGGKRVERSGDMATVQSPTGQRTNGEGNEGLRGGASSNGGSQLGMESNAGPSNGEEGVRGLDRGRTVSERGDGKSETLREGSSRRIEKPQQKIELGTEKVPYRQQSNNPFALQSQMPAAQAEVVKKALEDIGDVDEFLVKELGYSSVEDMYRGSLDPSAHGGLAAEQIDSVAMAIHQMKNGDAFIIGDQTGIGKGRQGAALIRWACNQGMSPIYFTKTPDLFSGVYRDLKDIGSKGLRPFILASSEKGRVTERQNGKDVVIYDLPSKKEVERVLDYINKNGKLPPEYDYIVTTYSQISNGTMEYENGSKKARNFGKKSARPADINGQKKRDVIEKLAANSIVLMDESHEAGGDSARGNYLQYVSTKAKGITYISATFAKRPDNMPIYSLRTAISKAGVKVNELIEAVKRGGATFQEIMSKALTEAGQMIRRERDMTGVTVDWKGIEDEEVIKKHYEQYDKIIGLFNDIIQFQRTYVDPIVNKMNDEEADVQGSVDHTPGTRDMGINNAPFASRTHVIVKQVLLALKAEEGAKFAVECLKNGEKPVIALENTNEGAADKATGGSEEDMEMPDLSVNLKEGLRGTLRISREDAFGNDTKEMIPFDRLSPEGQARYREIMDAIDNASTGLSLSPIDVIRDYIKKAGYSVEELTGRSKVFDYNKDGTVKRVNRDKNKNKKRASDFNEGMVDALIVNKSACTGIDLHAGIKFKNTDQRHMIVVQAQADINDEVQMRGRTDRTGQKQHSKYTYIVSSIPSEQRLLMMLKAKLRSLDANTTSSQKSKFNEMQVQDIINKYGDEIVIQYLAEHPDLAGKMCDPLKWEKSLGDGYETQPAETLIANAEKNGEEGKTASKVLGRMALLTVKEQEKMLAEIGELYQAEIDRLNEMGENDLEITEMPLKAKTLKKDVWEEGVEPGGKNPFADNSYVEQVEMDILKKPMKADEVKKSQARLLGGKTWEEYKQGEIDKVEKWAEEKKEETRKTFTERAEKKAKVEQERYVKGAKKAQEKNGMTDDEIERNGQLQYKTFYNQEMDNLDNALQSIDRQKQAFVDALDTFTTDGVYAIPTDIYDLSQITFEPSFGKVIDIKISDNYSTNASTITFATLDGRRKITIPINGMVKQNNGQKMDIKPSIVQQTAQARHGMFGSNVSNTLRVLEQNVDNWDKLTSTATRKRGYIITGNLLKALTSLRSQGKGGKLISYTTDTGEIRQGILMSDNFDPKGLTSKNPISTKKDELKYARDKIESADGDVSIRVTGTWDWRSGGYNTLELTVPKSKKRGEKYFNDETLLSLMDGQFEGSTKLKAEFRRENLDAVLKRLDELGVTVESTNEEEDTGRRFDEDIEEGIAEKEVTNVIVDTTKTPLPKNRTEAIEAVSKLKRPFINKDQGKEIVVSNTAVKHTVTQGRENADTQCLGVIDQIIENAVKIGEVAPKAEKIDTIEKCEIYYCPVNIDGHQYSARLVVNQYKNRGRVLDEYKLYDLRTKEKSGAVSQATGQNALTSLSASDLRYKVKDLIWNTKQDDKDLIGINNRQTRFDEGVAAKQQQTGHKKRIAEHIDALAEKLGTKAKTTVYHSLSEVPEDVRKHIEKRHRQGKKVRGWYENGQVYLFLPDIESEYEAERTIWHETVAHHGLRELVGAENYDKLLTRLWMEHKDGNMGKWVSERMTLNGWSLGEAIDEYLAREAEQNPFKDPSLWQRLRWMVADILHKMGFGTDPTISDIQYLFWVSQNQLKEGDAMSAIKQQAFLHNLERAAENTPYVNMDATRVEDDGRRFSEDIEEPLAHSAKWVYNDRLNRAETMFTEAYQDAMVSLKTAQNAIAKDKDIPDSQNAYQAENLMHGKNKNEMDLFNQMFRDPLIDTINKIMNLTGMNWGDVDRYVYTKSGLERNREFYMRDWLAKERKKSISKLSQLNDTEKAIFARMAQSIEEQFEDGEIATEEEKNKKLLQALQDAHNEYLEDIESGWQREKGKWDTMDYPQYLANLDTYIRENIDSDYEPSEHDYSGFRAMFGDENGKYDESEVIDGLMNTEGQINSIDDANNSVETLWEQIRNATRYGLERYREAGMRSDEQIDNVEQMFHWYVPMRGFKEDKGEDMYQYFTSKGSSKSYLGGLLKHAKGRGSEANFPISTIFAMTYKAISDCNQNLVNQKLYRLCQANPNDLVVLSDSWAVLDERTGLWEESSPEITDDMNEEEIRQATLAWEDEMKRLASENKATKITGKPHFDYVPMDKQKKSEHIVDVRINGKPKQMIVTSNPRMAQALNGQLRFERGKNVFSKWNAAIKNFMASLFTSYSPTFALRNMFRDWTHFRTMLSVREGEGYAKQASKYYRESLFKMVGMFKKYREGTLDMNNEMERDFKDYMDNGGITGFVQMQKIDDIQKEMEKLYKQQKEGKAVKLNNKIWDYTLGAVEAVNEGIENNARFATYRASRHYASRTRQRSAYDAKEITVNFNKKGAGAKTAGFKSQSKAVEDAAKAFGITSQILGEGRIFFNATVQAIATTFKNFQNADGSLNKKYIAKWAAKYAWPPFMFGLLLPAINKALAAALGGDDDDPYANQAEWTRRKNICIYIGNDNFITIPIGQELAAFLTLGDIFAGLTYAPELKPLDKDFTDEMLGVINTFSPIDVDTKITQGGITEDPIDEVVGRTFSVLAPLVAVGQNLGWTGRPIYREDNSKNDENTPEYQMVYSGTNPVLVNASKLLHELGGGDDVARGKFEVNPAIIQYLWEQYTGGPGKVFGNTISIGKDVKDILGGKESEFNIRKVEGLKAFVQQGDERTQYYRTQAKYRKYKKDADELYYKWNGYKRGAADNPEYRLKMEEISKGADFVRMQMVREADKQLNKINKAANKAEGSEKRELRSLYNQKVKEVVELLDQVGMDKEAATK